MTGVSRVMSVRRTSGAAHGPVGPELVLVMVLTLLVAPPVPFIPLVLPLESELPALVVELPWGPLLDRVAVVGDVVPSTVALAPVVLRAAAPAVVPVVVEPLAGFESSGELQASATPPKSASTSFILQSLIRWTVVIPNG